jgi:hypothetical protein
MPDDLHVESENGEAYGRRSPVHNPVWTEVGPGTACGEFMRRYWNPVAVSAEVTTVPQKLRILGEDLVLFRDRKGRPGLLYPRCMHRGTTLYYGKVEEDGIRCCYHGWHSTSRAIASISLASRTTAKITATRFVNPGIRYRSFMVSYGPIWGRRRSALC